jgi:hypothetical protein
MSYDFHEADCDGAVRRTDCLGCIMEFEHSMNVLGRCLRDAALMAACYERGRFDGYVAACEDSGCLER